MTNRAIDQKTGKRILSFNFATSADCKSEHPDLICDCGCTLFPRGGRLSRVSMHFYHQSRPENLSCDIEKKYRGWDRRDLTMHTAGVAAVYAILIDRLSDGETLDIEVPIGRRRADLCILDKNNHPIEAHEIQLSRQSIVTLNERSKDYQSQGVDVTWWFGDHCDIPEIERWSLEYQGEYNRIIFGDIHNPRNKIKGEKVLYDSTAANNDNFDPGQCTR